MPITIQMIEEKEFKTKVRGYDPDEVDEFLDEIVDEFEAMQNEIRDLRARPAAQPITPVRPAPIPVREAPTPSYQEENLRNILVNAQRVADESIADAQKRAQEILSKATAQAESIVSDARNEAQQLMDEMDTLKAAASDYRARFQRLVDDQAHILKAETELFRHA